jgi:hypothetical protein
MVPQPGAPGASILSAAWHCLEVRASKTHWISNPHPRSQDLAWLQDVADVANVASASCRGTSNEAPRLAGLGPKVQEAWKFTVASTCHGFGMVIIGG